MNIEVVDEHSFCPDLLTDGGWIDELLDWLGQWYDIYGRVWEERHGCSENLWDVLLIAK